MKAPPEVDKATREAERALDMGLWASEQGFNQNPQRIDPSVRTELEEWGRRLVGLRRSLSEDAKRLLDETDLLAVGPGDGFDLLARLEAKGPRWVKRAIALFDEKSQAKITPGPGYPWDLRLACEALVDLWVKYEGPVFWRRDNVPLRNFVRAVIQTIEPDFNGEKLVREVRKMRKERAILDRLAPS